MPEDSGLGFITVSDGTILKFKVSIVDIREIEGMFSPFGGVFFDVKAVGGVSAYRVPEDLKKAVANKPVAARATSGWLGDPRDKGAEARGSRGGCGLI